MLEEVQMLPGAHDRVVNRTGLAAGIGKPAATRKADGQVKLFPTSRPRLEFDAVHLPRGVQAQGHAKELFAVHRFVHGSYDRKVRLGQLPGP